MCIAGRPCQSLMWGPWAVGMAVTDSRIATRFKAAGLTMLLPQTGIQLLTRAIASLTQHSTMVMAQVSWSRLLSAASHVPNFLSEVAGSVGRTVDLPAVADKANLTQHTQEGIQLRVIAIVAAMLGGDVPADQVSHSVGPSSKHLYHMKTWTPFLWMLTDKAWLYAIFFFKMHDTVPCRSLLSLISLVKYLTMMQAQ